MDSVGLDLKYSNGISSTEIVTNALEKDYVQLIDVRAPEESMGDEQQRFPYSKSCPLMYLNYTLRNDFLECVIQDVVANLPVIFACDSGNRATYAAHLYKSSRWAENHVFALKPGGVSTIVGYPLNVGIIGMNETDGTPLYAPKLYNNYVGVTTALGLVANAFLPMLSGGSVTTFGFLDVRSEMEHHSPGGTWDFAPVQNVPLLLDPTDPSTQNPHFVANASAFLDTFAEGSTILIYCASGTRAKEALTGLFNADPTIITRFKVLALQNGGWAQLSGGSTDITSVVSKAPMVAKAFFSLSDMANALRAKANVEGSNHVFDATYAQTYASVVASLG